MLKGYTAPLSPRGEANITPGPPWHYSGDCIAIECWANPEAVSATLPEQLSTDVSAAGRACAYFIDWQFTGQNEELLDPARYQYREFLVLVDA
jgi:acetoacetate decarboxylase